MGEVLEGWKFTVVDMESGGVLFSETYPDEYVEDAFAAFKAVTGGVALGTELRISEVV